MGRIRAPILLLSSLIIPVLSTQANTTWEPCPQWRGLHETFEKLPDWFVSTEWPKNDSRTVCNTTLNREFGRIGAHTTVTLHQSNNSWQQDHRKDLILSEIHDAINAGLDLFGMHAGTAQTALNIHITIDNVTKPPEDYDSRGFSSVVLDDEFAGYKDGIASPCNMIIIFPLHNSTEPIIKLKKDIVKNMYHCVQRYHHPKMNLEQWWYRGIARFFDGMIWPTPAELIPERHASAIAPYRPKEFPELYIGYLPLFGSNDEANSLLWHWAYNTGWSLHDITEWMKQAPSRLFPGRDEQIAVSADNKIAALFHSFARAAVAGEITYADGSRIKNVPTDWGAPTWDKTTIDRQLIPPGEERDLVKGWMEPWRIGIYRIPLAAGQVIDATLRHKDFIVRDEFFPHGDITTWWQERRANITEANNATVFRDLEWSYRREGESKVNVVPYNETLRIEVPSEPAETVYEFVVTCAGGYKYAPLDFRMKRI
ncbi:hypothetical protein OQA88_2977 [Cercophora sp. LCS_1]